QDAQLAPCVGIGGVGRQPRAFAGRPPACWDTVHRHETCGAHQGGKGKNDQDGSAHVRRLEVTPGGVKRTDGYSAIESVKVRSKQRRPRSCDPEPMPELPEVEAVRRQLEPVMVGARIARVELHRPDLRTPFPRRFAQRMQGATMLTLARRAKYLVASLSSGDSLLMHLGMSGSFRVPHASDGGDPHDHVVFRLASGAEVIFNDPRRFGFMALVRTSRVDQHPSLRGLGPEPLSAAFDAAALARACAGKRTSLKAALLDQQVVAGLGNIYAVEALHVAGLSPLRRASTIATPAGAPRDGAV